MGNACQLQRRLGIRRVHLRQALPEVLCQRPILARSGDPPAELQRFYLPRLPRKERLDRVQGLVPPFETKLGAHFEDEVVVFEGAQLAGLPVAVQRVLKPPFGVELLRLCAESSGASSRCGAPFRTRRYPAPHGTRTDPT